VRKSNHVGNKSGSFASAPPRVSKAALVDFIGAITSVTRLSDPPPTGAVWRGNPAVLVEGNFFHITPDLVVSPTGLTRSELGIHFDANFPGSAGCIVLSRRFGWERFGDRMRAIARIGH